MSFIIEGISYAEFQTFLKSEIEKCISTSSNKNELKNTSEDTNRLLSRKECAEKLQISLPTLNQWTKDGLIVAHRISTRVRYRMKDIDESLTQVKSLKDKRRVPGK